MNDSRDDLVEIWKSLELLVVSLDRIGSYEVDNGKSAAIHALDQFFNPRVCNELSNARSLMVKLLEDNYGTSEELEQISENSIRYWNSPKE